MAIDFPASPTTGQTFAPGTGVIYQWTGTLWLAVGATGGGGGDFCASLSGGPALTSSATTVVFNTILSGNLGGWYQTSGGTAGRYTPPAGRYKLSGAVGGYLTGGTTHITATLRKNGVAVGVPVTASTAGAAFYATAPVDYIVDANGTDYFDIQGTATSGTTATFGYFDACSIPAAGTTSMPSTSWRQLARVVPTAGQASVDFQNIPSDINDLMFHCANLVPVVNDVGFLLRYYDGTGTIDAGNNYAWSLSIVPSSATLGTAPLASAASPASVVQMTYGAAGNGVNNTVASGGISLDGKIIGIRNSAQRRFMTFNGYFQNGAASATDFVSGGGMWNNLTGAISGVRFLFNSSNFAAGGAVTLWGSP